MKIPVLVPYRTDGGYRDRLWEYLTSEFAFWGQLANDYTVVIGDSPEGPFNRSAAINDAARKAGDWDVVVIADADTWVPESQLDDAVHTARRFGCLVSALTSVIELSEDYTNSIINGHPVWPRNMSVEKVRTEDFTTQSSMIVVPRKLWDAIGGFDEKFVGWGAEDNAFWKAATLLGSTPMRIEGAAFHLWHPSADPIERLMDPQWRANWARWRRYETEAICECSLHRVQKS